MIKIFFVTFFIAELIIALATIIKIYQFDRCVNDYNKMVSANKNKIRSCFIDFRMIIEEFHSGLTELLEFIRVKREEYSIKVLKTSLIYGCIFLLRGKYKKSVVAYQLIREIYEGIKEAQI